MSTKGSKEQQRQQAAAQSAQTPLPWPLPSTSTPLNKSASPLKDKQDLANLNGRLVCYIEKVRELEIENSRLNCESQKSKDITSQEMTSIKNMYDLELHDTRKLLDKTSRERAKFEIDTKRLWDENEELKSKLEKTTKDLQIAKRNSAMFETKCTYLQTQFNQTVADKNKSLKREKEMDKKMERMKSLWNDARKNLEEETLQRNDLENHIQSLKEDISFKEVEISEIDGRLAEKYEAKLQQSLQELRDQHKALMRANRDEIEALYENKIDSLTAQVQHKSGTVDLAVNELRQARARNESLNQKVANLEITNNALTAKFRESENWREKDRARHIEDLARLESELSRLREEMSEQLKNYQDLMDIKINLDLEIIEYRKLLESEEARLNITSIHPSGTPGRSTPLRATPIRVEKRKRTLMKESEELSSNDCSASTKCDTEIVISEADSSRQMDS